MPTPCSSRLRAFLLTLAAAPAALSAQGIPVGFEEKYAIAEDRAAVVAELIPGTADYYYYRCRERLDARDFRTCLLYTSPSPRDATLSRMPSSA